MKKTKRLNIFILLVCLVVVMVIFSKPLMVLGAKIDFTGITHYQVVVDGKVEDIYTFEKDIGRIMEKENIELKNKDYVLTEILDEKTKIEIIRSYEEVVHQVESLPYEKIEQEDDSLEIGTTKLHQEGEAGEKVSEYVIVYENGEKIKEYKKSQTVVKEPQDEITLKGTKVIVKKPKVAKKAVTASRNNLGSGKVVTMTSTAYTHTGNRTATGIYPYVGVIAVDPKVIPLGTRVHVEGYGNAIAADTGGAIKGNIVDVFFNTRSECMNWGRKTVKVTILD